MAPDGFLSRIECALRTTRYCSLGQPGGQSILPTPLATQLRSLTFEATNSQQLQARILLGVLFCGGNRPNFYAFPITGPHGIPTTRLFGPPFLLSALR